MTRKEIYAEIKSLGLAEEVKSRTGKNYTIVSTNELEAIVKEAYEVIEAASKKAAKKAAKKSCKKEKDIIIEDCPFTRLIEVLGAKHILLKSEAAYILADL